MVSGVVLVVGGFFGLGVGCGIWFLYWLVAGG